MAGEGLKMAQRRRLRATFYVFSALISPLMPSTCKEELWR